MKAAELVSPPGSSIRGCLRRIGAVAIAKALAGRSIAYKYRLAYVVRGLCVLRYDNEAGKGDHRHFAGTEKPYPFSDVGQLIADFQRDIERWNNETRDA